MEEALQKINDAIESSRKENKSQYEKLDTKFDVFTKKIDDLERKIEDVEKQNFVFYDELDDIKGELNKLKQKEISLNLIVKGLAEHDEETLTQLKASIEQVMATLKLNSIGQFKSIKRIGKKDTNNKNPRLVLIETVSKEQKAEIIAAKRKIKITANQIVINGKTMGEADKNVYIDEHVTQYTAFLLKRCRDMKRELNLKYVWTKDGTIYVRKDDKVPATMIKCDADVDMFKALHTVHKNKRKATEPIEASTSGGVVIPAFKNHSHVQRQSTKNTCRLDQSSSHHVPTRRQYNEKVTD